MKNQFRTLGVLFFLLSLHLTGFSQKYLWEQMSQAIINGYTVCNAYGGGFSFNGLRGPTLFDFDNDGDVDYFYSMGGTVGFTENTGTRDNPCWVERTSNFGNVSVSALWAPYFADIDGDGLVDLITGDYHNGGYGGTVHYFKNISTGNSVAFIKMTDTLAGLKAYDDSDPAAADCNNDGKVDLVVGDGIGNVYYIQSKGNNFWKNPVKIYTAQTGNWLDDKASPELKDIDGDGLTELLIGRAQTLRIELYKPTITPDTVIWVQISNNYLPGMSGYFLNGATYITPMVAKYDNDDLYDIILAHGEVGFFKNIGTPTIPAWASGINPFPFLFLGNNGIKTYCFDMNGDGKDELIFKNTYNDFTIYHNDANLGSIPSWSFVKTMKADSLLQGFSNLPIHDLAFFNYDSDGLIDIVVNTGQFGTTQLPKFLYFKNGSTFANYQFQYNTDITLENLLPGTFCSYLEEGDVDDNNNIDILIYNGLTKFCEWYEHHLSPQSHWDLVTNSFQPDILKYSYSWLNPTIVDFDYDGFSDMLLPNSNTIYYKKTGSTGSFFYTPQLPNLNYCPVSNFGKMEFGYLDGQCGLDIYQNTNTGILMWGYRGIKPKITAPSTTTYNICDTNIVQLSALPTGGVWGGAANVGGSFIPAYFYASGDYWITYSYLDPQGCYTNVDSLKITITATTPVPTMSKTLRNITVASEQTVCYDATQNITLAGNDSSFLVQEGGTVHLIAGQRIVMLPGTKAVSGSNLHGFISHNCLWCSAINGDQPQFISTMKNSDLKPKQVNNVDFEDFSLQIYPNPTKGDFTIDLLPKPEGVKIQVLVFSSLGEQVLQTTIGESAKVTLSIEDQPAGIYIVKVILKGRVAIVKIIKS